MHVFIPDTQSKPGVPNDHLQWAGRWIEDKFAQRALDGTINLTVVHAGDHHDLPSLSSYDKGKRTMEGRRVKLDIDRGNHDWSLFHDPWEYLPARRIKLFGNHEERLVRAVDENAQFEGLLSLDDLESPGWERIPFRQPIEVDGVVYCHYFENTMTGKPLGGQNIETRLKNLGHSFTMGHQQTLGMAIRFVNGRSQHGLVAGAFYQHDEDYKGPQGNAHWRGIVACHEVDRGSYDIMPVSMNYLCRRYTGHGIAVHTGREL